MATPEELILHAIDTYLFLVSRDRNYREVQSIYCTEGGLTAKRPSEFQAKFSVSVKVGEGAEHPLLTSAKEAVEAVAHSQAKVTSYSLDCEAYTPDGTLLGQASAIAVVVESSLGARTWDRKAWAISYDWAERIGAKFPALRPYTEARALIGRHNYPRVRIRLPSPTPELQALVSRALSSKPSPPPLFDLERQIKEVEEEIRRKAEEMRELEARLSELKLKLQLERMKEKVIPNVQHI
ncbi:MAG: hypothetical protein QXD04_06980 [Candidatus Bathyarchaeia archaeon]